MIMIMTMWQVNVSGGHKPIKSNTFLFTGMSSALLYISTILYDYDISFNVSVDIGYFIDAQFSYFLHFICSHFNVHFKFFKTLNFL